MKKEKVSLFKGNSRYENILSCLEQIKPEILEKLKDRKNIVIKPNCVSDSVQLASIHVDAIRAVLDFLKQNNIKSKVIIAEGSAYQTKSAFENFNYHSLKSEYNVEFKDLNNDTFEEITIFNKESKPIKVGITKTLLDSDCVISLALLKTHDSVLATFGIKNIAVGSLIKKTLFPFRVKNLFLRKVMNRALSIRNDKVKIHQGSKIINKNIFEIYKKIKPDISIIDGFEGMEGNGPVDGTPVSMKLALAGTSPIAVDIVASQLMGLNPDKIGYLYYILEYEKLNEKDIKVIGNTTPEKSKRKFKLHDNIKSQMGWRD